MKRILGLGLILLLAGTFAFAGGGQQAAPSGRVEITYSFWGSAQELVDVTNTAIRFNNSQDRITVRVEQIPWEVYESVLNTRALAGLLPDAGMLVEQSIATFANAGLLANAAGMYPADDMPLESVTFTDVNGNPVAYSSSNEILMLFYNREMFDRAGVPYPPARVEDAWTWDQFVDVARRLTFDTNGRNPGQAGFDRNNIVQYGVMVENLAWQLEVWALSNGSGFYNSNGTQVIIDQPAAIEAIQRVADLHLVHNVAPFSAGLTDDGVQRSMLAGNVAMTTNGQWNVGTAFPGSGINYGVGVLPYMREKVTINTSGATVVFNTGNAQRQAAAMEFVRWMTDVENVWDTLVATGIWMPNKMKYYTDPALTARWVNNPNFPPFAEYKSAVIDYTLSHAKPTAWYYTPNTNAFNTLLTSILGDVWTGARTAQQVITSNAAALRRAHAGQ